MAVLPIGGARHRTVVEALGYAAEHYGDAEAYVEPACGSSATRRSLTFGAWERAAAGLAGLMARRGVEKGDVVCLVLPPSIDYAVSYLAALMLGAVASGINPRLGPGEVASIFDRARPELTVVDPALGIVSGRDFLTRAEAGGAWDGRPPPRRPTLFEDDPVAVVWTSGTTGTPKGAVFDHRCLAAVADGADVLSRPGDRRLSPLPFAHVGYMTKIWDEIAMGITTVVTPSPWRAAEALSVIVEERITVAQGVPTQWSLMLAEEALDSADLSALRIAATGGAPMPAAQVAEVRRRVGVPVVVRYASTEAAICTGTVPEDPDDVVAETVGRPVPGVELSLVEDGTVEVGPGEVGRVRIRSKAVMRGYAASRAGGGRRTSGAASFIDAAATAAVLSADRWLTTGDLGTLDDGGNLRLVGRQHERFIRGGYNVYPVEVESVLAAHPAVARAAVVGVRDPVLGEVGVAFVVPARTVVAGDDALSLSALRRHCSKSLADYKSPDAVVVVDELPVTPMMKVDKRALAERALAEPPVAGAAIATSERKEQHRP